MQSSHNDRINVLVTIDYEIFGNGSGDVKQHMIDPTNMMADICESLEIPLTLFFEVEEFMAFRKYAKETKRRYGYNAYELIENQAREMSKRGHDLQLHIHPQWYGCTFHNGQWILNGKCLALEHITRDVSELGNIIKERIDIIDGLRNGTNNNRKTIAYRAGGFWAQPCQNLLPALNEAGILYDSSVVAGYKRVLEGHTLDYSITPFGLDQWSIKDNVNTEDSSGLMTEVPVASVPGRRWQQISLERIAAKFSKSVPNSQKIALAKQLDIPKYPQGFIRFLFNKIPLKLDVHNNSVHQFARLFNLYVINLGNSENKNVVLIGHSKDMANANSFQLICKWLKKQKSCNFITFADLMNVKKEYKNA